MTFENKLIAVLNKDIEHGVAMNALAHMIVFGPGDKVTEPTQKLLLWR